MLGRLTRWVPALRIAWRDARRHRGRTVLVLAMIVLPVLAGTVALTAVRSSDPSDATLAEVTLGEEAQARLLAHCPGVVQQDARGDLQTCEMTTTHDEPSEAELAQRLPAGASLVAEVTAPVAAGTDDRSLASLWVVEVDVGAVPGRFSVADGRLPQRAGEVALAPEDATTLDAAVGDVVTLTPAGTSVDVQVTGVLAPRWGGVETVAWPGTVPDLATVADEQWGRAWYVVGPEPVTWDHVLTLNDLGATVVSRDVLANPPDPATMPVHQAGMAPGTDGTAVGIVAAVVGIGLLEIVLLIGPAFAVGARRSTRQLAVLAASGGAPADLRRVVLASGLVLGLVAGLIGVLLGALTAWALLAVLAANGFLLPEFVLPGPEMIGLVVLAVVLGVAASWLPARRAAKQDVVAALAGRRSEAAPSRKVPWIGVVLVAAGLTVAVAGGLAGQVLVLLGGALVMEAGIVLAAGGIIALVGRLAPRVGPAARIALRDAARQRGRTAPAVAAVIAAIAGMAGAAVYAVSDAEHNHQMFRPYLAEGTLELGLHHGDGSNDERLAQLAAALEQVTTAVPVEHHAPVHVADVPDADDQTIVTIAAEPAPGTLCPLLDDSGAATAEEIAGAEDDPRCAGVFGVASMRGRAWTGGMSTYVDDGSSVALYGLPGAADAAEALRRGDVLVNSPDSVWDDGHARLSVETYDLRTGQDSGSVNGQFPAETVTWTNLDYDVILSPQAAAELGLATRAVGTIAVPQTPADPTAVATAAATLEGTGVEVAAELPQDANRNLILLVLVGAAALVGLGATWVSVGLAAAEARPDLATLAAVGAAPRTRRRVAGAQAAVIAGIGVPLGVLTGLALGAVFVVLQVNLWGYDPTWRVIVPWPALLAMAVGIPLLAVLCAMAGTRSRLPLVRRVVQ